MFKFSQLLVILGISTVTAFMAVHTIVPTSVPARNGVYERVIETATLRCGYFEEAPFTIVDPNTGKKTGIAVELAEKIAGDLGLKIEWVPVANFASVGEDLRNGRFDAVCGSYFNLPRAGSMDYTSAYAFVPVFAYTQAGRAEFDHQLDKLDWSNVTIAGLDGEGATTVARKKLPQARFDILPQLSQIAVMLTSVADRKSDIAFVMPTVFKDFDKANPGKLRQIASDKPFHVFAVSFALKPDEPAFKNMLDFVIKSYAASGELDDLFHKYDADGLLFRPTVLYQAAITH
jgi:ABC-type amino acid transport substrate-binding protein